MHKLGRVTLWAATLAILLSSNAMAQSIEDEVAALKAGQEQIQKDLAEIKRLIQAIPRTAAAPGTTAFQPADLVVGKSAILGNEDAAVTLIGFSDYQCPFCRRHATTVYPELIKKYVDTGKVKIVMREYPIENIHSRALKASQAALCAADQDKYWEMHDLLFTDTKQLELDHLRGYAENLGLNMTQFNTCLDLNTHTAQIRADQAEAQKLGISGTPSFVLGLTNQDDTNKVHATKYIRGAKSLPNFETVIEELLASADE